MTLLLMCTPWTNHVLYVTNWGKGRPPRRAIRNRPSASETACSSPSMTPMNPCADSMERCPGTLISMSCMLASRVMPVSRPATLIAHMPDHSNPPTNVPASPGATMNGTLLPVDRPPEPIANDSPSPSSRACR